ncbi:conserved secreted protein [Burkholderia pseudomallei]|nr:conserved secreted protein [Burkholderia pseudomallei]VCJ29042.1 conserved secreted protein [Burkholderia pseudomallei]
MKTRIALLIASAAFVAAANVQANDAHHPTTTGTQGSATTSKSATTAQAGPAAQTERFEEARRQMQKMMAQMDQIRQTKDPAERQKLMDEHMRTMQDTMQSMHAMGGPMMMDMMGQQQGMGGVPSHSQSGKRGSGMNERMEMMERRMDMMQMMMEQMLQQQKPPAPAQ